MPQATKSYTIYCHINKINGKRYVGITSQNKLTRRFNNGLGYKHSTHFFSAIKKYGWDNFEHLILDSGLTEEEAKKKEIEYIALWNTTDRNSGYNITEGGEHTAVKGRVAWNKGRKCSPKELEAMSKRMLAYYETEEGKLRKQQIGNEHRGQKHTEQTKKKMSEAHKGKLAHRWTEEARSNLSKSLKEKKVNIGLHWFNDGQKNVKALVCPEGFVPGILSNITESTRLKLSSAAKRRWLKEKEAV